MGTYVNPIRMPLERNDNVPPRQTKQTDPTALVQLLGELLQTSRSTSLMGDLNSSSLSNSFSFYGPSNLAFAKVLATALQGRSAGKTGIGQLSGAAAGQQSSTARAGADSNVPYSDLITSSARKHGVDAALVAAIVKAESGFNPKAQSSAGAKGLMQLMDGTARSLSVTNSFDPGQNLDGGVRFIRGLLNKYGGDVELALAGYNAGPGAVDRYGGIPPYKETQTYVSRVLQYWENYKSLFK